MLGSLITSNCGVTNPGTEAVERLQDISMASEQSRNQNPEKKDDERQDENESDHDMSFCLWGMSRLYRARASDQGNVTQRWAL